MKISYAAAVSFILILAASLLARAAVHDAAQDSPSYLYIEEFEFAPGSIVTDGIAEASQWVRDLRATGEFRSVRLYMHHTGPRFSVYIFAEPNDWQAIETGFTEFFEGRPDIMNSPYRWSRHSDDILSEVPVE